MYQISPFHHLQPCSSISCFSKTIYFHSTESCHQCTHLLLLLKISLAPILLQSQPCFFVAKFLESVVCFTVFHLNSCFVYNMLPVCTTSLKLPLLQFPVSPWWGSLWSSCDLAVSSAGLLTSAFVRSFDSVWLTGWIPDALGFPLTWLMPCLVLFVFFLLFNLMVEATQPGGGPVLLWWSSLVSCLQLGFTC